MALDVQLDFDERAFEAIADDFQELMLEEMSDELVALADTAKASAWGVPSWASGGKGFEDVTGALRSSIGGAVYRDGLAIYDNYTERQGYNLWGKPMHGGNMGVTAGRMLSAEVANEGGAELTMVVTAAMPYASELQHLRGRDVLASAWLRVLQDAEGLDERVIERVKNNQQG